MTQEGQHSTGDIVTVFARQGIPISTIARAMALPIDRVRGMCVRAREADLLQMIPPETPDDPRHALLSELTNLRAQLDTSQEQVREFTTLQQSSLARFVGVARLTGKEAAIVSVLVRLGRATKANIYHALYGGLPEDEQREPKIIDVFICKIRKKLTPLGIVIDTQWGVGWTIDQDNRQRLLALVESAKLPHLVAA